MLADFARLSVQSQNLANVDTVGYKRQVSVTTGFDARLDSVQQIDDVSLASTSLTDVQAGVLKGTTRPLDLALDGDGFFSVRTSSGVRYTRRGDFSLDATGRLVNSAGDPVLGGGGELVLPNMAVTIDSTGKIFDSNQQPLGQLDIAQFSDPKRLRYLGAGQFDAAGQAPTGEVTATRVRSGYLEASNVQPAHEMIGLMDVSRQFQLTKSVLTARDEMLDSAANTLAQF